MSHASPGAEVMSLKVHETKGVINAVVRVNYVLHTGYSFSLRPLLVAELHCACVTHIRIKEQQERTMNLCCTS